MTQSLVEAIAELDENATLHKVKEAMTQGRDPVSIVEECRQGIRVVGSRFDKGEYFLSELILGAEIFKEAINRMVDEVISEGITPVLHFDADWTPFLPFLRELPAKKCIFAPDQVTDLFKAKQILGDHMCLMGNVSPQVLALGTVDETVAECQRLIDVVGKGGGFILSSGCEVPFNAKPENVAAMVDTAKTYFPH